MRLRGCHLEPALLLLLLLGCAGLIELVELGLPLGLAERLFRRVDDVVFGPAREGDKPRLYSIVDRVSGEKIGEMSSRFTNNINQTRNTVQGWGSQSQLPLRLEGCWVRGIYTVTPADCESLEGLPVELSSGLLWCYVEIEGLAKAIWS